MADTEAPRLEAALPNNQTNPPQSEPPPSQPTLTNIDPSLPNISFADNGLSKRPRDARLVHMILASNGVTAYQERVPLQLMDFAYRYTSSTLQDALHLTSEGYGTAGPGGGGRGASAAQDLSNITYQSLRLSIASRTQYQFSPNLPKEYYQEQAQERNKVALPKVGRDWGLRLPPAQYMLTGNGWGLQEEWDEEIGEEDGGGDVLGAMEVDRDAHGGEDEDANEDEEGNERMEDVFEDGVDAGRDTEGS